MQQIYSGKYTYELVDYKKSNKHVLVTCKIHGPFPITPNNHRRGKGCRECGIARRNDAIRGNLTVSVKDCKEYHGDKYDYSLISEYTHAKQIVQVVCKEHGAFPISWDNHKTGFGCPECGYARSSMVQRDTIEVAMSECLEHHGERYDYSLVTDYINQKQEVQIICKEHGVFSMTWGQHRQGQGCQKCAKTGYKTHKHGHLYVLQSHDIVKVGITNKPVGARVKNIVKSSGYDFKILTSFYFADGQIPYNIEKQALKYLRTKYQKLDETFDGSTECFRNIDVADLLNFITPLAAK